MKKSLCLFFVLIFFFLSNVTYCDYQSCSKKNAVWAQADGLSPLDVLVLDLKDVKRLIEEGDNKNAIVILKSAQKQLRKVKEFDSKTKKVTEKRIIKGIKLLKQNKNQEALDLLQTGFDALEESGLIEPGTFA